MTSRARELPISPPQQSNAWGAASSTIISLANTPNGILWLVVLGLFGIIWYMFDSGIQAFKDVQVSTNEVIRQNTSQNQQTQETLIRLDALIREKLSK